MYNYSKKTTYWKRENKIMKTVFIDGSAGTTGLRIRERLAARADLEIIALSEEKRKDATARREALNSADIAFLCLPDDAAREAVSMIDNDRTVVLDTSTAHRTNPAWAYGFPELSEEQAAKIRSSKRIAVPGCHASGFIALVAPLVRAGLLSPDARLACTSLTGYSGGGKKMIAEYEGSDRSALLSAPRQYALGQKHKHLPEMTVMTGLSSAPAFLPIVGDFYSGMEVTVPLFAEDIRGTREAVARVYAEAYSGPMVTFIPDLSAAEGGFLSAAGASGLDSMQITLEGNDERLLPIARYDNLGKGASGAAVQCLNLVMNVPEETGLQL